MAIPEVTQARQAPAVLHHQDTAVKPKKHLGSFHNRL